MIRTASSERRYELLIRQEPKLARMQGFSEKDRRVIDPPPIVQVFERKSDGRLVTGDLIPSMLVLQAVLCSRDGEMEYDLISVGENESSATRLLLGSLTAPLVSVNDPLGATSYVIKERTEEVVRNQQELFHSVSQNGSIICPESSSAPFELIPLNADNPEHEEMMVQAHPNSAASFGHFFVLTDLSVRTEGIFRLKFKLFDLSRSISDPSYSSPCLCQVISQPFKVYSVKTFPGMSTSTELSRSLARQGLKIPLRN